MFKSFSKFFAVSLVGATVALTSGLAQADNKVYVVGTEAGYAPFEYLDASGKIVGFDIDLINYLCKEAGITCEVKNQSFDSLIPSVKFKKIDMTIAGLTVTAERAKQVAFTQEYLPGAGYTYVVLANKEYKDVSDLKAVAYQNGTLAGKYLTEKTKLQPKAYESYDIALIDLKAGRVQALLADTAVAQDFTAKYPELAVYGRAVQDPVFGQGLAIAVHLKNDELLAKLNAAIAKAKESGFIDQLKAKYNVKFAE